MSAILGVFAIGPNPAACILRDGALVAMSEEERHVRLRDIELAFPAHAISFCLEQAGLDASQVDAIAYAWDATRYPAPMLAGNVARWLRHNLPQVGRRGLGDLRYKALINAVELAFHDRSVVRWRFDGFWSELGFGTPLPPIRYVPHHLAHAASAFYCSGFDSAAILTIDRNGEDICTGVWEGMGQAIHPLRRYRLPNSLGWFYSGFTDFCGFRPEYHEGHLMGLAAYGAPDPLLDRLMVRVAPLAEDGSYRVDPTFFYHGASHGHSYTQRMVDAFGPPRLTQSQPLEQRHKDIAFAAQQHLERAILGLVRQAVRLTGMRRLCIAGGVGLNCVANGKILESGLVDEVFIQPASNDAGSALGAAQIVAADAHHDPRFAMKHAFYGPSYTSRQVEEALAPCGLPHARLASLPDVIADLLADDLIVARFQGHLEIGPRALGARSILASPFASGMAARVNAIKGRASWRPLGPAILDDAVSEYCEGAAPTPFMTVTSRVRPHQRERLAAVVHVDGTTRPQVVCREDNLDLWHILTAFAARTGVRAVVNTSFNVGGDPIVCSPTDAIRTFVSSDIDALAIEDVLVWKPTIAARVEQAIGAVAGQPVSKGLDGAS